MATKTCGSTSILFSLLQIPLGDAKLNRQLTINRVPLKMIVRLQGISDENALISFRQNHNIDSMFGYNELTLTK